MRRGEMTAAGGDIRGGEEVDPMKCRSIVGLAGDVERIAAALNSGERIGRMGSAALTATAPA
jgi:hypothetical protein